MTHLQGMRIAILATMLAIPGSAAAQAPDPSGCTDIQAGTASGYTCINQQLQAIIQQTQRPSSAADAPYTATSPGNVTGQFNESATRNRLGTSFGKSVTPQRPVVNYAPPLSPHA